jgi:cell division protein FtsN
MSHAPHQSDRAAAYRGLIIGAIAIAAIVVTIVKMVNASYEKEAPAKTGSTSSSPSLTVALDA